MSKVISDNCIMFKNKEFFIKETLYDFNKNITGYLCVNPEGKRYVLRKIIPLDYSYVSKSFMPVNLHKSSEYLNYTWFKLSNCDKLVLDNENVIEYNNDIFCLLNEKSDTANSYIYNFKEHYKDTPKVDFGVLEGKIINNIYGLHNKSSYLIFECSDKTVFCLYNSKIDAVSGVSLLNYNDITTENILNQRIVKTNLIIQDSTKNTYKDCISSSTISNFILETEEDKEIVFKFEGTSCFYHDEQDNLSNHRIYCENLDLYDISYLVSKMS